ncbi:hypothetical protein COZ26_00665, partial [Candidatus Kuenenbacteria bacterium CG_4_10_14_3_um_filter_39_14]
MTNGQYIIFAFVSILLLASIFLVWIISDFGNNNESLPLSNTNANSQSDNSRTDPLITSTKELYGSLINEN